MGEKRKKPVAIEENGTRVRAAEEMGRGTTKWAGGARVGKPDRIPWGP